MQKEIVRQRFLRSAATYNQAALVQRDMAAALMEQLLLTSLRRDFGRILEIGCGQGLLTAELAQRLEWRELILNDLVPECAALAEALPRAEFLGGDIEQLELPPKLDLIVGNAVLQWVREPERLLAALAAAGNPGCLLAFSVFGPENFRELRELSGSGLAYPPVSCWPALLANDFELLGMHEEVVTLTFDSPEAVLLHLKATGVTATGAGEKWTRGKLRDFAAAYRSRFAGPEGEGVTLTYHPLLLVAEKRGR